MCTYTNSLMLNILFESFIKIIITIICKFSRLRQCYIVVRIYKVDKLLETLSIRLDNKHRIWQLLSFSIYKLVNEFQFVHCWQLEIVSICVWSTNTQRTSFSTNNTETSISTLIVRFCYSNRFIDVTSFIKKLLDLKQVNSCINKT